jgi:tRNA(fMet)-specific endonuclease VapC
VFVLDTNTLIYFFRDQGAVKSKLLSHSPQEIGIPTVVVHELFVGIEKSPFFMKKYYF